jgi:hypothetical protein
VLPMGLDQLTLWAEGESAAQLAYDEALHTYWYTIESLADEYDPSGYATALATYAAAVGGSQYTAAYAPGSAAWVTFSNAVLAMADEYAETGAASALAILTAAYNSYESAYSGYEVALTDYTNFLSARTQAIAQQIANPYIVNGQPSG